ncbi:hypothetical protein [Mariniluteicoccus flavus]
MSTGPEEHEVETTQRPRRAAAGRGPAPDVPDQRGQAYRAGEPQGQAYAGGQGHTHEPTQAHTPKPATQAYAGPQPADQAYAAPDSGQRAEVEPAATPAEAKPMRKGRAPRRPRTPSRFSSNLDLNADVPTRAQPAIGDWGPNGLPTTREKRRQRWVVPVALALITIVVIVAWRYFAAMLG